MVKRLLRPRAGSRIAIVTPYLADANNGNWRTAHRWAGFLESKYDVILQSDWQGESCDLMIALHARRSHSAIARLAKANPPVPILLVLTGTDIYRDIRTDPEARASLDLATALVVLQEDAIQFVPAEHRRKTHVIFQSARVLKAARKARGGLNCVMVGHLRPEKDPLTAFRSLAHLDRSLPVHLLHIGRALDDQLRMAAQLLAAEDGRYSWVDGLPHGLTRAAIKRAHVLIHPSLMEGGANVIVEALTAGTPVLASRMSGNVGMLGKDYPGYFDVGDDRGLAALMKQCLTDANFYSRLNNAAKARAALFQPEEESRRLRLLVSQLLPDSSN